MIERKIIIGLITSTEYCQSIKRIWNPQLIESVSARRLAIWVWEYFSKYNKAPGKHIETIFYAKAKDAKLPKDVFEEIEQDILPSLSEEYTEGELNLEYLIEETEKHFNEQHLRRFTDDIQKQLSNGNAEEANKLVREFKPLEVVLKSLDTHILTARQIRNMNRPVPGMIVKPWLREGEVTIIYGGYGTGKSLVTILIAYLVGLHKFDRKECEIGRWQVKRKTGCLYIDGEMGELEMEDRLRQYEWLGPQSPKYKTKILSIPQYQLDTEDTFLLSDRKNQMKVIEWLKNNLTYRLIVLDSVSTLFGLDDENNNSEWNNKINPFLRDLRALGVACILLHHAGKDDKRGLRGASAMGAMAQNIFRVKDHPNKSEDRGEAWFTIGKDKQRKGGVSFPSFSLHFSQDEEQLETHWKITDNY